MLAASRSLHLRHVIVSIAILPFYRVRLKAARLYKHDAQASESVRPEPTRLRVVLVFVSFWTA